MVEAEGPIAAWAGGDGPPSSGKKRASAGRAIACAESIARRYIDAGGGRMIGAQDILDIHMAAMSGIDDSAGQFRKSNEITILGSKHVPTASADMLWAVVDYSCLVAGNKVNAHPTYAAAHIAWSLAWVHPFEDGNGRVSRAAAHAILCCRLGEIPGGSVHWTERLMYTRIAYYRALEEGDRDHMMGGGALLRLRRMIEKRLREQVTCAEVNID